MQMLDLLAAYKVALDHTLEALGRQAAPFEPDPAALTLVAAILRSEIRLGLRLLDLVDQHALRAASEEQDG